MKPILLATSSYGYLADELAATGDYERGAIATRRFPDGEKYLRIDADVERRDVVLVGGTISDEATLELFDLGCASIEYGAHTLTLLIPWFGYATMERATQAGEVVTAKTRARLISAIPQAGSGNRVVLFDLHSEGIPHYFEGSLRPYHVYGKELVFAACRALGDDAFVLASTDAGRAKWVESLANDMHVPAAFVIKRRLGDTQTDVAGISAEVSGKRVVIYDDMIRTGTSLLSAARAYLDAGATSVAAVASHGVFPGDALERIAASGLLTDIIVTNSHPRARELSHAMLRVVSVAPVFAAFLG